MVAYKKNYYYSLILTDINRFRIEEEIRGFYLPVTKNSIEKQQQFFPSLASVMEPSVNFFKSNDGRNCLAMLYGYERRGEITVGELDKEGESLWLMILELILSFAETMKKSHEFELYVYGMAFDEGEFGWFLYSSGDEIRAKEVYNNFPKKYVTI